MPRTAAPGVTKSGIFASLKSGFTSAVLLRSSQLASTGLFDPSLRPSFTASTVAFAASADEASAVGTFITSTASVFPSRITSLIAALYRSGPASPMISTGLPWDQVGGRTASSALNRLLVELCKRPAQIRQRIGCQNARPAAICNNGKAAAGHTLHARDHLR